LLLSTNQPLSIKDVQAAFTRFHDQATALPMADAVVEAPAAEPNAASGDRPEAGSDVVAEISGAPVAEVIEVPVESSLEKDPELYSDVPSLVTATQIREAMDQITAELRAADEGLVLVEGSTGYRLMTHPRFGRWLRILRQEPPPVKLSQSAIETLAVVAYRQPVTRSEIENIRGVSAEAGLNKLLERELVYITGRADTPGRPIQYGTTDQFLEFVGIKALDEMPASDVLSSRQIDEWLKNSSSAHKPTDTDMGLSDEELPLEGAAAVTIAETSTEVGAEVAIEAPAAVTDEAPAPVAMEEVAPETMIEPEKPAQS
jgi:segregation and condensation protein B